MEELPRYRESLINKKETFMVKTDPRFSFKKFFFVVTSSTIFIELTIKFFN